MECGSYKESSIFLQAPITQVMIDNDELTM